MKTAEKATINVSGMTCAACSARVQRTLEKTPGVETAAATASKAAPAMRDAHRRAIVRSPSRRSLVAAQEYQTRRATAPPSWAMQDLAKHPAV